MEDDGRKNRPTQQKYRMREINGEILTLHVIEVERVLGKRLPDGAVIHHVDGDGHNNAHSNLVVCPDQRYHLLLHVRQRAYDESGHADWRKCPYCKRWDDPANMVGYSKRAVPNSVYRHKRCQAEHTRNYKRLNGRRLEHRQP